MRPKLTIITPSFNQAGFIERTLRSVLDQGYENLEYIVVDGGSTDGSVEVIRRYEDHLAWWVTEPDAGQTDALNKALGRATGDVIGYINSDDVYLPGAFHTAAAALGSTSAKWVVGACRFEGNAGFTTEVWRPELPRGPRSRWILGPWGVPQPSTFWRREVFEALGRFREDMHFAFDTEHSLRLVMNGWMPELLQEELAVRVLHEDAKSAEVSRWDTDLARLREIYLPRLTARDRFATAVHAALARTRMLRVIDAAAPVTATAHRMLRRG